MIKHFNQHLSQKDKTLKHLYSYIFKFGPITKPDLVEKAGLKQSTCTRLIDELLTDNLIKRTGEAGSSGGRKPVLFAINPTTYHIFGIDISRTYTKILLMDMESTIIDSARLVLNKTTDSDIVMHFLMDNIQRLMKKHSLSSPNILGVGIGSVGPLNREEGTILDPLSMPSNGWESVNIKQILEDNLDINVFLDYGVNTALFAEYQRDSMQHYQNIALVIKGVGSRTGIIIDGHLARGSDKVGRLGQGHMIVNIHGKKCVCGSYGCVQAYSSILAVVEEVTNRIKEGKKSILSSKIDSVEGIQFQDICSAVNLGDELCCDVIKEAGFYAGIGLSNLINILHPDLIILSGPMYTNMDLFFKTVKETASEKNKIIYPEHQTKFRRGALGENAAAIGAGSLVLNHYVPDPTL